MTTWRPWPPGHSNQFEPVEAQSREHFFDYMIARVMLCYDCDVYVIRDNRRATIQRVTRNANVLAQSSWSATTHTNVLDGPMAYF